MQSICTHMFGISFMLLTALLSSSQAWAGSISAELNRTEGEIGETFGLTVFIEGQLQGDVQIPAVNGLVITRSGYNQSMNIINGQAFPEVSLIYTINPQQSGVFTIPGISATIDGKKETTVPLTLNIRSAGAPSNQAQTPAGGAKNQPNTSGKRAAEDTGGIFIERECANKTPYLGEQVVCTVRINHRDNLVGGQRLSENSADIRRFHIEGERRFARTLNGQRYSVIELREIIVTKRSGEIPVPPFGLQARILTWSRRNNPLDKFFDRFGGGAFNFDFNYTEEKEVTIRSEQLNFQVKPLPEEGKPANFAGVVGEFNLNANLSKNRVPAGETLTITVELSGTGILDSVADIRPQVDALGRVYNDKPEYKEEVTPENGIRSSKIFKYALVPKAAGEYDLGAIEVPVFNPKLGQYTILRSELGKLIVEPGAAESTAPVVVGAQTTSPGTGKEDVKVLGQDLLGPHRTTNLMDSQELTATDWGLLAAMGGGPMTFALGAFAAGYLRSRRSHNPRLQRRAKALRLCTEAMERARQQCQQGNCETGISTADRAFREFLGDKLGQAGSAFTSRDVDTKLTQLGLSTESRLRATELQSKFERVAFGGRAPAPDEAQRWIQDLEALVEEIDPKC